ncbi:MAG: transglycosylase SLT domain-containing protein [Anaerolineaceae bacterium]|nr:transglycosylase SLT domain-containing protein [Anaerolineaceae bacterium]
MMNKAFKYSIINLLLISILLSSCGNIIDTPVPLETVMVVTETPKEVTPTSILPAQLSEPISRIKEGDDALLFGDYDSALDVYALFLSQSSDPGLQAAAYYGAGLTYFKMGAHPQALAFLRELISLHPEDLYSTKAIFLIGLIYIELDRLDEALAAFESYLLLRPNVVDSYIFAQIGDIHIERGDYQAALKAYESAYLASHLGDGESLAIKIAHIYSALGETDIALSLFQDIYFNSSSPLIKAQMDIEIGRLFSEKGQINQAYEKYQDAVNNFPGTYDAYNALVLLVNEGQEVNELLRGQINANIGQYTLAIEAYNRYLLEDNADIPTALYYKALAIRALGLVNAPLGSSLRNEANQLTGTPEDNQAIDLWRKIIIEYPASSFYVDTWEDIAYTQAVYKNNPEEAASTSIDFIASSHSTPEASTILFTAGRYYETAGKLQEAAETWSQLGATYTNSAETFQSLLFAGITYYRLGNNDAALLSFNRALVLSLFPLETSAAYLWIGKILNETGNQLDAQNYLRQAVSADPYGYYGLRASELLNSTPLFQEPPTLELNFDLQKEKIEAENWMIRNFNLTSDIELSGLGNLVSDDRFIRGSEFWSLGLYTEGRDEFENLRTEYDTDPVKSFQLIDVFHDLGLYRSAIEASNSIISLAGMETVSVEDIPVYFAHIIYGLYYLPWVQQAAEKYDIPLLFLMSLIHQESRFEGFVESSAGALGLMQIIPGTAAQIAGEINYPQDFSISDLSIPFINLQLGANYLGRQILLFDGDLYAAAAAYNGGPGNALIWKEIAGGDPDLFIGAVRYLESRTYIRRITEIFSIYTILYAANIND